MRSIGINEISISTLEDTYTGATARAQMYNQVLDEIPVLRGVRQGDPISAKLFTSTFQEVFQNAQLEEKGINIDGEKLAHLRFAHDVAFTTENVKDLEYQLTLWMKEA